jgi:hypothetical protein
MEKEVLFERFRSLRTKKGGIESLVADDTPEIVTDRLLAIDKEPISKVQFDQLLGLCRERAVSDGFFHYYWLSELRTPYNLEIIPGFSREYSNYDKLQSIDHLIYGLQRIYIDGLLYRGDVRAFFRENANRSSAELDQIVGNHILDTAAIKQRGPTLPLKPISKDNRYLISEMACKSYGDVPAKQSDLKRALLASWDEHEKTGGGPASIRDLLSNNLRKTKYTAQQGMLEFSADDILDKTVTSRSDIEAQYAAVAEAFLSARGAALENTRLYLSLVNDLDVYVATSMRTRRDFRMMADRCESIFGDAEVRDLNLRYFDPTTSATEGHQDKGLIECLMVKCAKVLVYCAGDKESFGKDAEAAMALSLGKPVIFLCDEQQRQSFYREVHPLSRLINFENGVAVGAMVTSKLEDVSVLLRRLFENKMEYSLHQPEGNPGYLQLIENLTQSVVRLQTNDGMLSEAFWNYYKSHR